MESVEVNLQDYNKDDRCLVFSTPGEWHIIDVVPYALLSKMFALHPQSTKTIPTFRGGVLKFAIAIAAYKMGIIKERPTRKSALGSTDYSDIDWYKREFSRSRAIEFSIKVIFYPQGRKYFKKSTVANIFEYKEQI